MKKLFIGLLIVCMCTTLCIAGVKEDTEISLRKMHRILDKMHMCAELWFEGQIVVDGEVIILTNENKQNLLNKYNSLKQNLQDELDSLP